MIPSPLIMSVRSGCGTPGLKVATVSAMAPDTFTDRPAWRSYRGERGSGGGDLDIPSDPRQISSVISKGSQYMNYTIGHRFRSGFDTEDG